MTLAQPPSQYVHRHLFINLHLQSEPLFAWKYNVCKGLFPDNSLLFLLLFEIEIVILVVVAVLILVLSYSTLVTLTNTIIT